MCINYVYSGTRTVQIENRKSVTNGKMVINIIILIKSIHFCKV